MLAFLTNLSWSEIAVVLVIAVLIFGKRLPQVAGDVFREIGRLRRRLDDLRRESGIDREILGVKSTFQELQREVGTYGARSTPLQDRREPRVPAQPFQPPAPPASAEGAAPEIEVAPPGADALEPEAREAAPSEPEARDAAPSEPGAREAAPSEPDAGERAEPGST